VTWVTGISLSELGLVVNPNPKRTTLRDTDFPVLERMACRKNPNTDEGAYLSSEEAFFFGDSKVAEGYALLSIQWKMTHRTGRLGLVGE
jgi:hypothetical protein